MAGHLLWGCWPLSHLLWGCFPHSHLSILLGHGTSTLGSPLVSRHRCVCQQTVGPLPIHHRSLLKVLDVYLQKGVAEKGVTCASCSQVNAPLRMTAEQSCWAGTSKATLRWEGSDTNVCYASPHGANPLNCRRWLRQFITRKAALKDTCFSAHMSLFSSYFYDLFSTLVFSNFIDLHCCCFMFVLLGVF